MDKKVTAIVIGGVKYGENDKILTLLTAEEGKLSCIAKGVLKPKARLRYAAEPFCFGNFELSKGKGLDVLTGCDLIDMCYELRLDILKFYIASFLTEVVSVLAVEGQEAQEEFLFLVKSLRDVNFFDGKDISLFAIKKIVEVIGLSGYGIDVDFCAACGKKLGDEVGFSNDAGGFLCGSCKKRVLPYRIYKIIRHVKSNDVEAIKDTVIEKSYIVETVKLLASYIEDKLFVKSESLQEFLKLI